MDHFLWYCLLLAEMIALQQSGAGAAKICVTHVCHCHNNTLDNTMSVTCRLQDLASIHNHLQNVEEIHSLDLSSSQVKTIPASAFRGFSSLVSLNLTNNMLKQWDGEVTNHIPNLKTLDVTGNKDWFPSSNVLTLPNLLEIRGVTLSKESCNECSLLKNVSSQDAIPIEDLLKGVYHTGIEGDCRATEYTVAKEIQTFAKYGFYASCLLEQEGKCLEAMISAKQIHRCWDVDNYILNVQYLTGTIALALNIIVICNTLTDKNLRRNVALLLVTNMAASDTCIALYALILTTARKIPYEDFLSIMDDFCPCVGFIWLVGQIVTITTSVLLTIERYLAIVYCMKPDARLRRQTAVICIAVFWAAALVIAIFPAVGIGIYTSNTYCVPVRPRRDIPHMFGLGVGIGSAALLLYLSTIPLYAHIYIFVTRAKLGGDLTAGSRVKKDFCLARRIAVMVLSNMLFFCIPVFIGLLWIIGNITKGMSPVAKEIITGVVPTVCFTINSLVNPLLYAFRNDKFMHSLRTRLRLCHSKTRAASLTLATSTRSGLYPETHRKMSPSHLAMPHTKI